MADPMPLWVEAEHLIGIVPARLMFTILAVAVATLTHEWILSFVDVAAYKVILQAAHHRRVHLPFSFRRGQKSEKESHFQTSSIQVPYLHVEAMSPQASPRERISLELRKWRRVTELEYGNHREQNRMECFLVSVMTCVESVHRSIVVVHT